MSTSRTREKADGELFKSTGIDDNATSTAVTIDANENVGIGSTPATDWHSNYSVLQVGGQADIWTHKAVGAGKALHISHNAEYDTGFKFIANDEATLYVQGDGAHRFSHGAYGTAGSAISFVERLKIDFDGLTFQGNTGGAATALDDYEEGTFTPAGTGINTGTSVGFYTKVGNVCHTQMWIHANGSTDGTITGLPFTAGTGSSNAIAAGTIAYQNGSVTGILSGGASTTFTMYNGTATGSMASGNQMHCAMTYRTT